MLLHPKHEAFCRLFHQSGNAAEAARDVGFSYEYAANQGYRLLKRDDIQARLAEFAAKDAAADAEFMAERAARRAKIESMAQTEAEALLAKLDPVYEERLEAGDHETAMKVIELQARIAGLLVTDDEGARKKPARLNSGSSAHRPPVV
jgi:phage terminase small subunit